MNEWIFPISPIAASRPRLSKHGAYYTGPYKRFREECAECVYKVLGADFEPLDTPLSVDLELYITRPKTTKLTQPKADIDNFVKAIFDVMNKRLWVDDTLVRAMYATKQWASLGEPGYFTLGVTID
jgi:Holliday junction resolvase RusA-like endonuclease